MALTGTRRRCLFRQPELRNTYTDIEKPTYEQKYQVTTNPGTAAVTDDWDYVEQFDEFFEQG